MLQKAVTYIKEVMDMGFFALMSRRELFMIFSGSPLSYVLLPMLGILFSILTLLNGYDLFKASNKNIDRVLGFVVSFLCCVLTSASLYGAVIANAFNMTFLAGPWLFLASVSLALTHQLLMIGLNALRAYESAKGSAQRMHYIQALVRALFQTLLILMVAAALIFVMITPIAPAIGSTCALTVVALTAVNIFWRLLPDSWKRGLKSMLGLAKPHIALFPHHSMPSSSLPLKEEGYQASYSHCLFVKTDHVAQVAAMSADSGALYMTRLISEKITRMKQHSDLSCDKNKQKIDLLNQVLQLLDQKSTQSIADVLSNYPLAFQSFWAEQGEVEQIVRATSLVLARLKLNDDEDLLPLLNRAALVG